MDRELFSVNQIYVKNTKVCVGKTRQGGTVGISKFP